MRTRLGWPSQADNYSCGTLSTSAVVISPAGGLPTAGKLARMTGSPKAQALDASDVETMQTLQQGLLLVWLLAAVGT